MKKITLALTLMVFTSSAFAFVGITSEMNGEYSFQNAECRSLYFPLANKRLILANTNRPVTVIATKDVLSMTYYGNSTSSTSKLTKSTFNKNSFNDEYSQFIKSGSLLFNGKLYHWNIAKVSQDELEINYFSRVVFLGLPNKTRLKCILTKIQ